MDSLDVAQRTLCSFSGKTLYDGIPDSKWHLFVGARHMPFAEQNDEYCQVLEEWLAEKD